MNSSANINFEEFSINPFLILENARKSAPSQPALISRDMTLTFEEFYTTALNLAAWLRLQGIRVGDVVSIFVQPELRPILTFALFHEAAVSCFPAHNVKALSKLGCRVLVTADPELKINGLRSLVVDNSVLLKKNWTRVPDFAYRPFDNPDKLAKISFSSGSTGAPKAVPVTVSGIIERLKRASSYEGFSFPIVSTLGFSGAAAVTTLLLNFLNLQPIIVSNRIADTLKFLNEGMARNLQCSPAQLGELLQEIKKSAKVPTNLLHIFCSGSRVPVALAKEFRENIGTPVSSWFGASEVGSIAINSEIEKSPNLMGRLLPGVEVAIVDSAWLPVEDGTPGRLILRSPGMSTSYRGSPKESEEYFRDGWFSSGDEALKSADGSVTLLGRTSDYVNAGGVKTNLQDLDDFAVRKLPVSDAAGFVVTDHQGIQQLGLAFVSEKSDPKELLAIFRRHLWHSIPDFFFKVTEIPRSEMGKPLRKKLERDFRDLMT